MGTFKPLRHAAAVILPAAPAASRGALDASVRAVMEVQ
jgi:hypothetical protein